MALRNLSVRILQVFEWSLICLLVTNEFRQFFQLSLFVLLSLFAFFAAAQEQEEQADELALAVEDGGDDVEAEDGDDDTEAEDEDEDEEEAPEVDNRDRKSVV